MREKIPKAAESGEDDAFLIRRLISRSGRGGTFINGNLATLGMLSEIGEGLLPRSTDNTSIRRCSRWRPTLTSSMSSEASWNCGRPSRIDSMNSIPHLRRFDGFGRREKKG